MANIKPQSQGYCIVAETAEEQLLLAHGAQQGNQLILLDGYYVIIDACLALPSTTSSSGAQRICTAFEQAARAHYTALTLRRAFRLVEP
jgi:hypothetical protein